MENEKQIKLTYQNQLNLLIKELLDNIENVEMIAILDQDGLPLASLMKSEDDEVISAISASFDNFVGRIKREFSGSSNRIRNIMNLGDMTFFFASAGDEGETAILTMVGNKDVIENEMRIYGDFAVDKITALLKGTEGIVVEIPRLVKLMAKFGKIPTGEYSMKLIVCGDYAVGKTSLIRRLVDDAFKDNYIATLGVDITKKTIKIDDNFIVNFLLWDVSGQIKQMAPYRKRFYTGANALFIVFDKTRKESFQNIGTWLQDISSELSEKIPKILVANKNDLIESFEVSTDEIRNYAEELKIEFIETSAKTGENVLEAFKYIGMKIVE